MIFILCTMSNKYDYEASVNLWDSQSTSSVKDQVVSNISKY